MSLRAQLQAVYDQHGRMTPEVVVEAARPTDHPLHHRFEWDDRIAGEAWRRVQAGGLIRQVTIEYREPTDTDPGASVRAWQCVRQPSGSVYEPAEKVAQDPFLTQLVARDMERDWKQFYRRWGHWTEFADFVRGELDQAS